MSPAERYAQAVADANAAELAASDADTARRLLEAQAAKARVVAAAERHKADEAQIEVRRARAAMLADATGPDGLRELAAALRDGATEDDIKSLAIALVERFTIIKETP